MVQQKLQKEGKIIVYGDPLTSMSYSIEGIPMSFAGNLCVLSDFCKMSVSAGGLVYDPELNVALGKACYDETNYRVICYPGN
jgi:hypothetical protein